MTPIIDVCNLSKRYWLSGPRDRYVTARETAAKALRKLFSGGYDVKDTPSEFWALNDVSFSVDRGDVVGIIGRNGAGKSTLLKILSRITEPTKGKVRLRGRVASLLEVGTGFHPELTGRENIFLNGAILGMRRSEIRRKFDEIVEFAEVHRFLDTPVKRYSSGMYVRLAFSVAAHLESEILVVDEVLAVGDAQFQAKCLGKMSALTQGDARTVLFVSHNIAAVNAICKRAIYLISGEVRRIGKATDVAHEYLTDGYSHAHTVEFEDTDKQAGNDCIRIRCVCLTDQKCVLTGTFSVEDDIYLNVTYSILKPSSAPRINVLFTAEDGQPAFVSIQTINSEMISEGTFTTTLHVPSGLLNSKSYAISVYATSFNPDSVHAELKDCVTINVIDDLYSSTRQSYQGTFPGVVRPKLAWATRISEIHT